MFPLDRRDFLKQSLRLGSAVLLLRQAFPSLDLPRQPVFFLFGCPSFRGTHTFSDFPK
jgi:hypothetical protein